MDYDTNGVLILHRAYFQRIHDHSLGSVITAATLTTQAKIDARFVDIIGHDPHLLDLGARTLNAFACVD